MENDAVTIWHSVANSPVGAMVRESAWAYPILETIHMVGLGLLFGCIAAFDLRLLGWHREISAIRLGAHLLPWVWTGFLLNLVSGALLFASNAPEFAANRAFQIKIALILFAGVNMLWFRMRVRAGMADWDTAAVPPASARVAAIRSLVLWIGVITAGRMIAYWD